MTLTAVVMIVAAFLAGRYTATENVVVESSMKDVSVDSLERFDDGTESVVVGVHDLSLVTGTDRLVFSLHPRDPQLEIIVEAAGNDMAGRVCPVEIGDTISRHGAGTPQLTGQRCQIIKSGHTLKIELDQADGANHVAVELTSTNKMSSKFDVQFTYIAADRYLNARLFRDSKRL